jgi:anti-anti-sigma factor
MASEQAVRWTTTIPIPTAHLSGEIDLVNAGVVFEEIRAGVTGGDVVVDFTDVTFIDSTCLAELIKLRATHQVRLVAPPGQALSVLKITSLTDAFPTFDTVNAAQLANGN